MRHYHREAAFAKLVMRPSDRDLLKALVHQPFDDLSAIPFHVYLYTQALASAQD